MHTPNDFNVQKVGVVIQGPLFSSGRTGDSDQPIVFDCSNNIEKQYALGKSLGFKVLISTWESDIPSAAGGISPEDILISSNKDFLKFLKIYDPHQQRGNKYRQFWSTYRAALELEQRGCDYILKIRTDQEVDLKSFKKFTESGKISDNCIAFPFWHFKFPNYPIDFYFSGTTKIMIEFLKNMLHTREMYANVHLDIFYKWTHYSEKKNRGRVNSFTNTLNYFPKSGALNSKQRLIIGRAWSKYFQALPKEMWLNLKWRGAPNSYPVLSEDQFFATQEVHVDALQEIPVSKGFNLDIKEAAGWFFGMRVRYFLIAIESGLSFIKNIIKGSK